VADSAKEKHAALEALRYQDNCLLWGERPVSEIAAEAGQTPFYAYDRKRIAERVQALRKVLPAELHIHYAMKANPMPAVVHFMAGLVDGLDVASAGELEVALTSNIEPKDISFAGPGKQDWELEAAVGAGITVNLESISELERIARISERSGVRADVAVRVNPSFELKTAGMKMGGRPSPFGIDAERIPDALERIRCLDLHFRGFHVFSGSQNLRVQAITESLAKTVELVIDLAAGTDLPVEFVNLGGGLGIPYFPREKPIDLTQLSGAYEDAATRLNDSLGNVEIITELGRFLVGEAGIYVCRVVDVKDSRGQVFVVCDGGLHHHLAASGNFGQVIRKNYPVAAVVRKKEEQEVSVVGPLCTPLDLLADGVQLPVLAPGDLVAVLQSGAYGRSASPARFLSHPECLEILV
jgi:diaminopimelate decarboxylase